MKNPLLVLIFCCTSLAGFSQTQEPAAPLADDRKNAITIGILQGGGSLIGFDVEHLFSKSFGVQAGAGLVGFGAGLNVHFTPNIRSSFLSLQYWHQGAGEAYTQSVLGPNFVFRGKKWFTFQLGTGFTLEKGPGWPADRVQPPVILMYSLGGYIPW